MSTFYKMDPAAWDFGTAELTLEQEAAYLRIVNAIHKHDAPVPNNDRVLAGLFRCSTRKARSLLSALITAKKVTVDADQIWNERARSDMVHRQLVSGSAALRGSKGGRTRTEAAAKALKEKELTQATASSRIEENRIDTEPIGSDGQAVDATGMIWSKHLDWLISQKIPDRQARAVIGKWLKTSTAEDVRAAFIEAYRAKTGDPIPYITRVLAPEKGPDMDAIFSEIKAGYSQ